MPQDPMPHPSSAPHHPISPTRTSAGGPVPFPSTSGSPPPSGAAQAAAGLAPSGTPPKAGAVGGKIRPAGTPKDSIPLTKTPRKQRSSRFHVTEKVELERLPGFMGACLCKVAFDVLVTDCSPLFLTEVPAPERHELFLQKLHQCAVVFDFNDVSTDIGGKQIKAATLAEMLEWITTQRGVITEAVYPEVVAMVCATPEELLFDRC